MGATGFLAPKGLPTRALFSVTAINDLSRLHNLRGESLELDWQLLHCDKRTKTEFGRTGVRSTGARTAEPPSYVKQLIQHSPQQPVPTNLGARHHHKQSAVGPVAFCAKITILMIKVAQVLRPSFRPPVCQALPTSGLSQGMASSDARTKNRKRTNEKHCTFTIFKTPYRSHPSEQELHKPLGAPNEVPVSSALSKS